MIRLILMLVMLPMLACSQGNDLGFWEGTPEKLEGCKLYRIQARLSEPVLPFSVMITDCYGNEKSVGGFQADGGVYFVCSMTLPTTGPLVQSITQDGWCTDPLGSTFNFWLEKSSPFLDPFPSRLSEVYIYSADAGGANRNLIYSNTNTPTIAGEDNAVIINDTFTSQNYYVVAVRARKSDVRPDANVDIAPGSGSSIRYGSTSFQTKEIVIEKRAFYLVWVGI